MQTRVDDTKVDESEDMPVMRAKACVIGEIEGMRRCARAAASLYYVFAAQARKLSFSRSPGRAKKKKKKKTFT